MEAASPTGKQRVHVATRLERIGNLEPRRHQLGVTEDMPPRLNLLRHVQREHA